MGGVFIGRRLETGVQRRPRAGSKKNAAYKAKGVARPHYRTKPRRGRSKFATLNSVQQGSRRSVSIAPRSGTRGRLPPMRGLCETARIAVFFDHRVIICRAWSGHRAASSSFYGSWVTGEQRQTIAGRDDRPVRNFLQASRANVGTGRRVLLGSSSGHDPAEQPRVGCVFGKGLPR